MCLYNGQLSRVYRYCLLVLVISINTGCELLPQQHQNNTEQLTSYYLTVTSFSTDEIVAEIALLKESNDNASLHNQLKLTLLYSLPSSPIHNPYTAKAQLNGLGQAIEHSLQLTSADLAFVTILKAQLNQQLLVLNKLQKFKQDTAMAQNAQQALHQKMLTLNEKVTLLTQQISQLQKIEKNISERD